MFFSSYFTIYLVLYESSSMILHAHDCMRHQRAFSVLHFGSYDWEHPKLIFFGAKSGNKRIFSYNVANIRYSRCLYKRKQLWNAGFSNVHMKMFWKMTNKDVQETHYLDLHRVWNDTHYFFVAYFSKSRSFSGSVIIKDMEKSLYCHII